MIFDLLSPIPVTSFMDDPLLTYLRMFGEKGQLLIFSLNTENHYFSVVVVDYVVDVDVVVNIEVRGF